MKYRILSNVNSRLIITVHMHWSMLSKIKLHQSILKSNHLTCSINHNSILSFYTRTRYILLLSSSSHKIFSNKDTIPSSRLPISLVIGISCTRISKNACISIFSIQLLDNSWFKLEFLTQQTNESLWVDVQIYLEHQQQKLYLA